MVLSDQISKMLLEKPFLFKNPVYMPQDAATVAFPRLLLLVGLVLLVIVFNLLATFVFHPLRKIPGPTMAALTHFYQFYHFTIRQDWADNLRRLHEQYGPIVRIGRNEVHINDTEFIYKYTSRRDVTKCDKYYASLEGTTAACTDAKEGMKRRARAIPSFTGKGLLEFSTSRLDKILHELCARLDSDSSVAKGGIVNFSHLFWAFSNDVTASFLFGKSLNWLKDPDLSARHDKRAFQAFRYTPLLNFKMYRRAIFAILQSSFMQARIPGGEIIGISSKFLREFWASRSSSPLDKRVAGAVVSVSDNFHEAERDCWEFLLTGGEGFTTEFTKLLQSLLLHPECLQKVMEEIQSLSKDGGDMPWRSAEVSKLKYLNACIKETIRMRIPEYLRISRKCIETIVYGDVAIPPMTSICMAITLMANDNLRFGQPEKFIPERWLGDSLEAQEARARYPSFGFGPRTCMGRELVYHAIAKTIVCLLCNFDLSITPEEGNDSDAPTPVFNSFPSRSSPTLKLAVRRRETCSFLDD